MKIITLLLLPLFLCVACQSTAPNKYASKQMKQEAFDTKTLMVYYKPSQKKRVLKLIQQLNARVVYDYADQGKNIFAIKVSHNKHVNQTKSELEKNNAVIRVLKHSSHR